MLSLHTAWIQLHLAFKYQVSEREQITYLRRKMYNFPIVFYTTAVTNGIQIR